MDLLINSLGIHDKALRVRNQRMELLARNIANEDTPHFKARELDFKAVMAKFEPTDLMANTHGTHFAFGDDTADDDGATKARCESSARLSAGTFSNSVVTAAHCVPSSCSAAGSVYAATSR